MGDKAQLYRYVDLEKALTLRQKILTKRSEIRSVGDDVTSRYLDEAV